MSESIDKKGAQSASSKPAAVPRGLGKKIAAALAIGARMAFVALVAWPVAKLWLGVSVRNRSRLPKHGPAIVAANHNSHLDAIALLAMMPLCAVGKTRAVAAADYFLKNKLLAFLTIHVIGILPVERGAAQRGEDPLIGCKQALARGEILIIFPEGSRGEPERMAELKKGIWHLAASCPSAPIVPVFLRGLGRSMPKGGAMPLPMFINCAVGRPMAWDADKDGFIVRLRECFERLAEKTKAVEITDEDLENAQATQDGVAASADGGQSVSSTEPAQKQKEDA
jgi:1-acyl-sn-glycerol-3-phosphate acyltransferase